MSSDHGTGHPLCSGAQWAARHRRWGPWQAEGAGVLTEEQTSPQSRPEELCDEDSAQLCYGQPGVTSPEFPGPGGWCLDSPYPGLSGRDGPHPFPLKWSKAHRAQGPVGSLSTLVQAHQSTLPPTVDTALPEPEGRCPEAMLAGKLRPRLEGGLCHWHRRVQGTEILFSFIVRLLIGKITCSTLRDWVNDTHP